MPGLTADCRGEAQKHAKAACTASLSAFAFLVETYHDEKHRIDMVNRTTGLVAR